MLITNMAKKGNQIILNLTLNSDYVNIIEKLKNTKPVESKIFTDTSFTFGKKYKKCWYCHRNILLQTPFSCPIKCNISFSMSEADKELYTRQLNKTNVDEIHGIYESEGFFDTLSCVQSYIKDQLKKRNYLYSNSIALLHREFRKMSPNFAEKKINDAPIWTLQEAYCTNNDGLTPEEFNKLFDEFITTESNNYIQPVMITKQKKIIISRVK